MHQCISSNIFRIKHFSSGQLESNADKDLEPVCFSSFIFEDLKGRVEKSLKFLEEKKVYYMCTR